VLDMLILWFGIYEKCGIYLVYFCWGIIWDQIICYNAKRKQRNRKWF